MPKNKAFHRRIQILDQCLRRRQMIWTVNALLDATNAHLAENSCPEVSLRTIYDDLRYLQDTLDAPVERFNQGRMVCYRYSDPAYTLVNSPLSPAEKEILLKMLDYLKANNLPLQAELADMLYRHGILPDSVQAAPPYKASETASDQLAEPGYLAEAKKSLAKESAAAPSRARLKKAEAPDPAALPAPDAARNTAVLPADIVLSKLVLRMENETFSTFRESFWKWLDSDQ